jgi:hypothetical protein
MRSHAGRLSEECGGSAVWLGSDDPLEIWEYRPTIFITMSVVKLFTNRYCNPLVATIITIIVILCYYCFYYCWVLLIIVIFILIMVGNVCLFTLRAIWGVSSSWALHIGEVLQWQLRLRDFTSVHQQWRASGWQRGFLSHGATPKAIVYDGTCFKHPLNIWMRGGVPPF